MKRLFELIFLVAALGVFLGSCGDDGDSNPDPDPDPNGCDTLTWYQDSDEDGLGNPEVTLDACDQPDGYVDNADDDDDTVPVGTVTSLTPEEHKGNLKTNGIDLVDEMSAFEDTEGIQTLISFAEFLDESEPEKGRIGGLIASASAIRQFGQGEINALEFAQNPHRAFLSANDDPETLQEVWDEYRGTFDWNEATEVWDYTEGGDVIQFNFPSHSSGSSNDASLTLSNYEGVNITNPIDDEYEGDLPTHLEIDLSVDGTTQISHEFSIDYSSEGEPELIETSLFVNPFTLDFELTNNDVEIGHAMAFDNGMMTLIAAEVELTGDFDDTNVENAEEPDEVFADGNFMFQVMNIKFMGEVDFDDLYAEANPILENEGEPGFDFDGAASDLEELLNEHVSISSQYVDTEMLIAELEFYVYVYTDDFTGEQWLELGARLVFDDESKIDIEDYFEEGFEQLEEELEDLFDQIENDIDF